MNAIKGTASPASFTITTADEAATQKLAAALARQCRPGDCIALSGDLGSGKTAFARGFIRALCGDATEVTSPTFTIMQAYPAEGGGSVAHFDLYRLRSPAEVAEIGLDEALQSAITLIEWPALVRGGLPAATLDISITMQGTHRTFAFSGEAGVWDSRLSRCKELA